MMQYYWQLHIKGWKSAMVWIVFPTNPGLYLSFPVMWGCRQLAVVTCPRYSWASYLVQEFMDKSWWSTCSFLGCFWHSLI